MKYARSVWTGNTEEVHPQVRAMLRLELARILRAIRCHQGSLAGRPYSDWRYWYLRKATHAAKMREAKFIAKQYLKEE